MSIAGNINKTVKDLKDFIQIQIDDRKTQKDLGLFLLSLVVGGIIFHQAMTIILPKLSI